MPPRGQMNKTTTTTTNLQILRQLMNLFVSNQSHLHYTKYFTIGEFTLYAIFFIIWVTKVYSVHMFSRDCIQGTRLDEVRVLWNRENYFRVCETSHWEWTSFSLSYFVEQWNQNCLTKTPTLSPFLLSNLLIKSFWCDE